MSDLKTVSIKGKQYVTVNERLKYFREKFPAYSLETELVAVNDETALIRAVIRNDKNELVATGTAYERRNDKGSFVNATSHVENAECVPLHTQILTRNGFRFFYELELNEDVLTLNTDTQLLEWSPLLKVSKFDNQPLVELSTSRFKAICTPQHKWVTTNHEGGYELTEACNFKASDKLILSAKEADYGTGDTDDAARLGWLFSDGHIKYGDTGLPQCAEVQQSKEHNFEQLERLFGYDYKETPAPKPSWLDSRIWRVQADEVRRVLGIFKIRTSIDLSSAISKMSISETHAFYTAVMAADGYGRAIGKTDRYLIEAMQVACARLGIKTGIVTTRTADNATKPIYILPIHSTNGSYASEIKTRNLPPHDVWCPTTKNGTWVAKQNGQVWITGNTSAWGRALANFGIGIDAEVASADEMQLAINSPKATKETPKKQLASAEDVHKIRMLCAELGKDYGKALMHYGGSWTPETADKAIADLEAAKASLSKELDSPAS